MSQLLSITITREGRRYLSLRVQMVQKLNNLASKRSEPSSRAALMGEQPNPWELLHPQDATSRHRCRYLYDKLFPLLLMGMDYIFIRFYQ